MLRPWTPSDRDACLAIFDTNVPRYFAAHERADFAAYLTRMPGRYLVVLESDAIVGCGGWARARDPRIANLCWGMIRSDVHGRGFGRRLLRARLADIRVDGSIDAVELSTSQHTPDFFAKEGFVEIARRANGFAPGIDAVDMRLDMARETITDVLFDLDGTLTDAFEGIARSITHALVTVGREPPPLSTLRRFVGPPLREGFTVLLGKDGPIDEAIDAYRARYAEVGMFENRVYDGVPEMLQALSARGLRLHVCTSKRRRFAERITDHFGLRSSFTTVRGSEDDGRFEEKADLVAEILRSQSIDARSAVMIGDREHDMRAGRAKALRTIGVTYGYGSIEELLDAGAQITCATPDAVPLAIR